MSRYIILVLMVLVIGLPLAFKPKGEQVANADVTLVVITPHNESIRYEFTRAFRDWYKKRTGKVVDIDWRIPGGTSEIVKVIDSEFYNSFNNHWVNVLNRKWSPVVENNFRNASVKLDETPADDTEAESARRAFLSSKVSSGLDVFFGGGSYDYEIQANTGYLVPSGIQARAPERFVNESIPQSYKGETFYDKEDRWVGAALSTFGILYNHELVKRSGCKEPLQWSDLGDTSYFAQIGVSDPTKSGSMNKAFEMIVQQQMQLCIDKSTTENGKAISKEQEMRAIADGWVDALKIIQNISANARYFTDSATKPVIDVAQGNCMAGMCIDFYGRNQEENIKTRTGGDTRVTFITPKNGTTVSTDPVGVFRGARSPELALDFIDFITSDEGQKLWNYKIGTPGGPTQYAIRRNPIRRDFYTPTHRPNMSDPDVNPYTDTGEFVYHPEWTGSLFSSLRFIIKTAFIDPHDELTSARRAIIKARKEGRTADAVAAEAVFSDVSMIDYTATMNTIRVALKGKKIEEVQLSKKLGQHFREQYIKARKLAEGH